MLRSGYERAVAASLIERGIAYKYESVTIPYVTNHKYTPDFILTNGVMVEAKGYFTAKDRTKLIIVRRLHPHADIRLLFQRPQNKLKSGSNTTYAEWCDRRDFIWAEGPHIPKEWTK